jgi:uncharacterized protein YlxP (DUF503 family)
MFVGVARLSLHVAESGSLKGKRQVLRKVIERVKARFNVSIAEVEDQDLWQRATLALAVIGGERRHVDEQVEKIIHFVEEMYVAPLISREVELLSLGAHLFEAAEEGGGEPGPEEAEVPLTIPKGDRSMAEAEGMGAWNERFGPGSGKKEPAKAGKVGELSPEQRRELARRLRNPREWEDE